MTTTQMMTMTTQMMTKLIIKVLSKTDINQYKKSLAEVGLETFLNFPYLYQGKLESELNYFRGVLPNP